MTINLFSVPAILSLLAKFVILYFSKRSGVNNRRTKLYAVIVLSAMVMNVAEISVLHDLLNPHTGTLIYYSAAVAVIAMLVHLAMSVSFDSLSLVPARYALLFVYGYSLAIEALLWTTDLLIAGAQPFRGYTYIRLAGPFYEIIELFFVAGLGAVLLLPLFGVRAGRSELVKSQCKLWVLAAAPLVVLVILVFILLHFDIRWFSATVTAPLLLTLLIATTGYAIHSKRLIEIEFYLPWSRVRRDKQRFYAGLNRLNQEIRSIGSIEGLIERLSEALKCPVSLKGRSFGWISSESSFGINGFPDSALSNVRAFTVAEEVAGGEVDLCEQMRRYRVAAILPLFTASEVAGMWLLLGKPFSKNVFSYDDFRIVSQLFDRIANALVDYLFDSLYTGRVDAPAKPGKVRYGWLMERLSSQNSEPTSLRSCIEEFECQLIEETLQKCGGNQAEAARLLGIRPNTLHYKLKRYGFSRKSSA